MTMVRRLRCSTTASSVGRVRVAGKVAMTALLCFGIAVPALAQAPEVHYRHHGGTPPGAIGRWQLQRGGPLPGYFQPVEIRAPEGVEVSLVTGGAIELPQRAPVKVGLLIAPVYRFRLSRLPLREGVEIYPSVEVIDRLYPPAGRAWQFPIPVELTSADIELALDGRFVTRVIYLEDPELALPVASPDGAQQWFDAGPRANPVEVADRLGRPVAILRIGSRLPIDSQQPDGLLRECAPVLRPPAETAVETVARRKLPLKSDSEPDDAPAGD